LNFITGKKYFEARINDFQDATMLKLENNLIEPLGIIPIIYMGGETDARNNHRRRI